MIRSTLVASVFILAGTTAALAQGSGQVLTQTQATLSAGFMPDPYVTEVVLAGNNVDGTVFGGNCRGWISDQPDFYLTYSAGTGALIFQTDATTDTTLIVQDPRGGRFCDDDGAGFPNARVEIASPMSGVYQVWIGTYERLQVQAIFGTRLRISDTQSTLLGPAIQLPLQVPLIDRGIAPR
ncbi:MAG: hypothetical protein KIT43_16025 [Bauldia sp.]|nr:hypothetical protein [Bauldia sp.]